MTSLGQPAHLHPRCRDYLNRVPLPPTAAPVTAPKPATPSTGPPDRTGSHGPHTLLTVTSQRCAGVLVLRVAGELDSLTAPRLHQALDQAVEERPLLLVVDLTAVEFLACAGLSVLVAAHRSAELRTCLRVVASHRATVRPLRLTGLDQYLAVFGSLHDASTHLIPMDRAGN